LGARFVSVITRDGKEHLIPNEDLITQKVINWSYSDTNVRLKIPVHISYSSNINKAMDLLVEAAIETPRVLESPAPRCLVLEFGHDSVELELRVWASDPTNGIANLKSAVLIKAWNKFHEHGICFPYHQRDVHLDINEATLERLLGKSDKPAPKRKRPAQKNPTPKSP
jgi:small-conductance mechanosensitive channel